MGVLASSPEAQLVVTGLSSFSPRTCLESSLILTGGRVSIVLLSMPPSSSEYVPLSWSLELTVQKGSVLSALNLRNRTAGIYNPGCHCQAVENAVFPHPQALATFHLLH